MTEKRGMLWKLATGIVVAKTIADLALPLAVNRTTNLEYLIHTAQAAQEEIQADNRPLLVKDILDYLEKASVKFNTAKEETPTDLIYTLKPINEKFPYEVINNRLSIDGAFRGFKETYYVTYNGKHVTNQKDLFDKEIDTTLTNLKKSYFDAINVRYYNKDNMCIIAAENSQYKVEIRYDGINNLTGEGKVSHVSVFSTMDNLAVLDRGGSPLFFPGNGSISDFESKNGDKLYLPGELKVTLHNYVRDATNVFIIHTK